MGERIEGRSRISTSADFGAWTRAVRRAQGLTQADLAAACGTSVRFIGELERGKTTCRLGMALHVLRMLGGELHARSDAPSS
jgi:y4mF family transcriptional regulator